MFRLTLNTLSGPEPRTQNVIPLYADASAQFIQMPPPMPHVRARRDGLRDRPVAGRASRQDRERRRHAAVAVRIRSRVRGPGAHGRAAERRGEHVGGDGAVVGLEVEQHGVHQRGLRGAQLLNDRRAGGARGAGDAGAAAGGAGDAGAAAGGAGDAGAAAGGAGDAACRCPWCRRRRCRCRWCRRRRCRCPWCPRCRAFRRPPSRPRTPPMRRRRRAAVR